MTFKVINNFLSQEDFNVFKMQLPPKGSLPLKWYDRKDNCIYQNVINKFIKLAITEGYDLPEYAGYELWFHDSIKSEPHIDKDEALLKERDQYSLPICSIIYYTTVKNLVGGKLIIEEEDIITPKNNKLVIFGPNVWHGIEDFTGIRKVFLVNIWKAKPIGYK